MEVIVACRNRGGKEVYGRTQKEGIGKRSDELLPIVSMKPVEENRVEIMQHQWKHRIAVTMAAGLLVNLFIARARAQTQPPQYVTTVWQTEQGLPQNSVTAILQDHRGYLWIGTFGGLARFDGQRFRVFDSGGIPGFGNNQILSLYESRSGVLWIGTEGGLIRLENGAATTYTERDGLPSGFIQSIRGDAEGNVWIKSSRGVAKFAGAKLEAYPTHRGKAVREFYLQPRDGSMWFRCGTDLVRFGADGSIATLHVRKPSVFLVHEARDGSVWVAVRDEYRLVRYDQGVFSDVPLPPIGRRALAEDPEYAVTMAEGADGELLLLTPAGLVRIVDGRLSPPQPLSLPANGGELPKVGSLLVDREGNLWVGMVGPGLLRLRPAPLTAYAKGEGLSDSSFNTVFQDREGRVWLGGDLLYWFDGHRFHLFPGVKDILAIGQTGDGDLWFGGYGGLYRWRSGVLSHFKVEAPAVGSIYQDREGTLWIGGSREERPGGLYRFRDGKLDRIPSISGVNQIIGGRDGGFWVAAIEGLFHVRGGKAFLYEQNRGLPAHLRDLYQDSTGTLWLATYGGGLFRFRDGHLKAITSKDRLPNNMLLRILEDGKGNLWVSSTRNIFRLSLKDLNDFADGRISSILPVSYGVAEGMRSSECNGGSPGGWKTRDGRIWFPTLRGVVAIDPTAGNHLPPPVVLEEAWANQWTLARDGQTSVPPGNRTFDFRFTALNFSAPEKLRFRYRLEPFDKGWVDAGTRRTAHYTNMAPGKYSFQVAAANDYGIWNEQGASVRFVLQPHFYQTNWFRALCAAIFLAVLWAAYQLRVHQLQKQSKQLRDVIDTIPGSVWSALPDGSLDFINRRWLEFSGVSLEKGLGWGWEVTVHPDDLAKFVDEWRAAVACGKALESEARVRRADGQYRWLLIRNVPLHDERGKVVKWYGTSTDIDDRKRAEEERERLRQVEAELAHLNRVSMLGELAVSIAHEVNQPLSGIVTNGSACLRFLARDTPNVEEAREAARDIVRDGKRAGEVIARIRALTKKAATPREKLDLNDTLREVLALVADEAKKRNVLIRTQFADDLSPVSGDRVQLQQVGLNLIMNGMEAMSSVDDRARELVMTTRSMEPDQVQVTVADSGIGLDPNTMGRIFEPFYTTKAGGMGMGLSISRSILQAHGGRLWATANDGPGTSFHFTLPKYHAGASNAGAAGV
jgi:PAS domain S-box-containing protein